MAIKLYRIITYIHKCMFITEQYFRIEENINVKN